MHLYYRSNFTTNKCSCFSKMTLVGFHYQPVNLDVNEICFEEEQDISNTRDKSRTVKALLNDADVGNVA